MRPPRRLLTVSIPKAEQDRELGRKLRAELSGILNWAVQGCLAWQREGLNAPKPVSEAVNQYRQEMDLVAEFVAYCCEAGPGYRKSFAELYDEFKTWCQGSGEE